MTMRVSLQMNELACEHWQGKWVQTIIFLHRHMFKRLSGNSLLAGGDLALKGFFRSGVTDRLVNYDKKYVVTN
ncbi:TPA: hypothetical protein NPP70_000597 [Klebsiella variicola subsp. variicola]|nr:hypothetical protein [Klebsiella variicola subsp. variicola]HCI6755559.1 hypothetical protein [Klebsiella variicola subsp. variicola]